MSAPAQSPSISPEEVLHTVQRVLAERAHLPGALLPVLHGVQDELGYVPPDSLPVIAAALNLSRAEVHGVVTYYHHFRTQPPGRCVVQVCQAEACQAMGAEGLMKHAEQALGCASHGTSDDGRFTLEPVYCLGLCALSPAVMVGPQLHARMTPQRLDAVVARVAAKDAAVEAEKEAQR